MISKIRNSITKDACRTLVHSLVTSRLDFQNAFYIHLLEKSVKRLQRVQNYAARLVCRMGRHEHITLVLRELHWLPVRQRVSYNILVLVYQCFHQTAPAYLQNLIQVQSSRHRNVLSQWQARQYGTVSPLMSEVPQSCMLSRKDLRLTYLILLTHEHFYSVFNFLDDFRPISLIYAFNILHFNYLL